MFISSVCVGSNYLLTTFMLSYTISELRNDPGREYCAVRLLPGWMRWPLLARRARSHRVEQNSSSSQSSAPFTIPEARAWLQCKQRAGLHGFRTVVTAHASHDYNDCSGGHSRYTAHSDLSSEGYVYLHFLLESGMAR